MSSSKQLYNDFASALCEPLESPLSSADTNSPGKDTTTGQNPAGDSERCQRPLCSGQNRSRSSQRPERVQSLEGPLETSVCSDGDRSLRVDLIKGRRLAC